MECFTGEVMMMQPANERKPQLRPHDDDEYVDEVRIRLVPRFKSSNLSGDEWRVSAEIQFLRKGKVLWSRRVHALSDAVAGAPWWLKTWGETDERVLLTPDEERAVCQQPGCSEPATHVYRLKEYQVSKSEGDMKAFRDFQPRHIWFCDRHAHRGDCDLEDCDDNYEVEGGGNSHASAVRSSDVRESVFAGVIRLGDKDEKPME